MVLECTSIPAIDLFFVGVQGQLSRIPMYDISYSPGSSNVRFANVIAQVLVSVFGSRQVTVSVLPKAPLSFSVGVFSVTRPFLVVIFAHSLASFQQQSFVYQRFTRPHIIWKFVDCGSVTCGLSSTSADLLRGTNRS